MSTKSDFTFGTQVGAGTYGVVWQAMRRLDGKTYAIKELDLTCLDKRVKCFCCKPSLCVCGHKTTLGCNRSNVTAYERSTCFQT